MPQTKKVQLSKRKLGFCFTVEAFHSDLNDDCPHHSDHDNKDDFANDDNDDDYYDYYQLLLLLCSR